MVRFRLPGGRVATADLLRVAELAERWANGEIQLTSRNNLQIRALPAQLPAEFTVASMATGLIPSPAHERIRTIVCSPMTGLDDVGVDLSAMPAALDAAICSVERLAGLPGRFLFVMDDGRCDTISESFDIGYLADDPMSGVIGVGGTPHAIRVSAHDAVATMVTIAGRFLDVVDGAVPTPWHIRELVEPAALLDGLGESTIMERPDGHDALAWGAHGRHLVAGVPLGLLTLAHAAGLAAVADEVVVTPWRSIVIPDGAAYVDAVASAGLVVQPDSPWQRVTACYGSPCANSQVDTRQLAVDLVDRLAPQGPTVHISGCARVCGEPGGAHYGVVAPSSVDDIVRQVETTEPAVANTR